MPLVSDPGSAVHTAACASALSGHARIRPPPDNAWSLLWVTCLAARTHSIQLHAPDGAEPAHAAAQSMSFWQDMSPTAAASHSLAGPCQRALQGGAGEGGYAGCRSTR